MKLDNYLMRLTQRAYLWLLDRTGVYVAALQFVAIAMALMLRDPTPRPYLFILLSINAAGSFWYYNLQHFDKKRYNEIAEMFATGPVRFCRWAITLLCVWDLVESSVGLRLGEFAAQFFWIGLFYLDTVKVRDREPPERRSIQPAMENSR